MEKIKSILIKILVPLVLGGAILYWMYRDFDFSTIETVLKYEMDWTWMIVSLPFGLFAQMFRGWRWNQLLEPLDEHPRHHVSINAVFMSYFLSLIVPRSGEFARCAILKRYDGISFSKALGTVVTERIIDMVLMLVVVGTIILLQMGTFYTFFQRTGLNLTGFLNQFSTTGYIVSFICIIAAVYSAFLIIRKLSIYEKVKSTAKDVWNGVMSVKKVHNPILFIVYTFAIWFCYFLHYYITFSCFDFTKDLGLMCALVTFVIGSIAVIVPTPNGAGPWHFAVKTMLILYGVEENSALYFVLIVHTIQTLWVVLIGIYAYISLSVIKQKKL